MKLTWIYLLAMVGSVLLAFGFGNIAIGFWIVGGIGLYDNYMRRLFRSHVCISAMGNNLNQTEKK